MKLGVWLFGLSETKCDGYWCCDVVAVVREVEVGRL